MHTLVSLGRAPDVRMLGQNRRVNIVVAVTGGIAAYKTVHLVRLLVKAGHDVTVVPTEDALRFVGTPTWEAISRHPVTTSVHDDVAKVRHVALGPHLEQVEPVHREWSLGRPPGDGLEGEGPAGHCSIQGQTTHVPVSYTHLTLPTILRV